MVSEFWTILSTIDKRRSCERVSIFDTSWQLVVVDIIYFWCLFVILKNTTKMACRFCGPKLSLCGLILSVWGIIQLVSKTPEIPGRALVEIYLGAHELFDVSDLDGRLLLYQSRRFVRRSPAWRRWCPLHREFRGWSWSRLFTGESRHIQ